MYRGEALAGAGLGSTLGSFRGAWPSWGEAGGTAG